MNSNHIRKITIVVSILLHLLFLLSYKRLSYITLFSTDKLAHAHEIEKRMEFELVETPDDASSEKPPAETNLLSDKNAVARDRYLNKDKQFGNPYAQGDLDVKNIDEYLPQASAEQNPEQQNQTKAEQKSSRKDQYSYNPYTPPKFSRQELLGKTQRSGPSAQVNRPKYNSEEFNAEEIGGLSFNTYAWDFAPYLLAMKHKIEKNVFPPPAFTHMGLISGETVLRFKVMPNGELKDLEVLNYKGHKSLMETSVNAITNSAAFAPLPSDFPENYLEVTASFTYFVHK